MGGGNPTLMQLLSKFEKNILLQSEVLYFIKFYFILSLNVMINEHYFIVLFFIKTQLRVIFIIITIIPKCNLFFFIITTVVRNWQLV